MLPVLLLCLFSFNDGIKVLSIGTFNCEFMNREKVQIKYGYGFMLAGEDLSLWKQEGMREKKFLQALQPVAKVIVSMNVDTLVLTEVGGERDVKDLRDEIKNQGLDYPWFFVCDANNSAFQHVAVLSRFPLELIQAKIPGRTFYDAELDDPEEERETDVPKALHVAFSCNGSKVNVIGVHLPSERNGYEQDAMRISVAKLIRRYSLPMIERGEHLVIAGDLNDDLGQPAIRMIRGREDMFEDLIQTGRAYYFLPEDLENRWTYMFRGERNQLDQILITRSLKDACLEEGGIQSQVIPVDIHFKPDLQTPRTSDHRAFKVMFHFKG